MRLFRDADYDLIGARRRAYVVSAVLIVAGLASLIARGGLNPGVEFTGGTMIRVEIAGTTDVATFRDMLTGIGYGNSQIQQLRGTGGAGEEYVLRVQTFEGDDLTDVRNNLESALEGAFGADGYTVRRTAGIGPKVGDELRQKALVAILLSFLLTLVYLAFRFEWRFGVAAVIATIHDIVITFGFIALFNVEITLATVAALLTIVGYSLNDTIVVFDRVRENLRKKRKEPYAQTLNRSINETLPRTVLTSGTTLMALLSLCVLGGAVIRPFALVLIFGVLIGTYSSIFVASPALHEIEERAKRRTARAPATT